MGNLLSGPEFAATVVQASSVHFDTPATLEKCEKLLEEAAQKLSQLVVFPEAFVGGYPRGSNFGATIGNRTHKGQSQLLRYHASAINVPGPEVEQLAAMAGKYRVYLIMGVIERDGYTLYSTALFFDCQGRYLGKQRKVTPTALERTIWGLGDGTIPVFKTELGKIGAAISWDNRMPLLRTAMYAKGVQIYCAPTTDASKEWLASMTHIALEGGCYVLSANQFCRRKDYPSDYESSLATEIKDLKPDSVVCAGGSVIISPSGQILQGPNHVGEVLLTANIDLNEIARAKLDFDVVGHSSRPEILSLVARNNPPKPVTFTSGSEKTESEKTEEFHK